VDAEIPPAAEAGERNEHERETAHPRILVFRGPRTVAPAPRHSTSTVPFALTWTMLVPPSNVGGGTEDGAAAMARSAIIGRGPGTKPPVLRLTRRISAAERLGGDVLAIAERRDGPVRFRSAWRRTSGEPERHAAELQR
jgi:hypothetical protein